jgi:hypothetical protein
MSSRDDDRLTWADRLKAQGWGYYRAAYTHGRGLWDHALAAFEQAEALYREAGGSEGRAGLAGALSGRGAVLRSSGDPEAIRRAIALYQEEIDLLRELGREMVLPEALTNLGLAYRDLATVQPTAAAGLELGIVACREALEEAKRLGQQEAEGLAAGTVADICLVLARLDSEDYRERHLKEALSFYGQAEKAWEGRDEDGLALSRLGLAEAYIALGQNLEGARDLLEEVLKFYEAYAGTPVKGPVRYQIAQVKELEARLLEAEGQNEKAGVVRRQAREHLQALGFGFE